MNLTAYILSVFIANSFLVEFNDTNCTTFLTLSGGPNKRAILTKEGDLIRLVVYNTTQNIQVYTASSSSISTFQWPLKTVDGVRMNLTESKGSVEHLKFNNLIVGCQIKSFKGGFMDEGAAVYRCKSNDTNKMMYIMYALYCIPFVIILCGVKAPTVVKFIKSRYRPVLNEDGEQRETAI